MFDKGVIQWCLGSTPDSVFRGDCRQHLNDHMLHNTKVKNFYFIVCPFLRELSSNITWPKRTKWRSWWKGFSLVSWSRLWIMSISTPELPLSCCSEDYTFGHHFWSMYPVALVGEKIPVSRGKWFLRRGGKTSHEKTKFTDVAAYLWFQN